MCFPVGSVEPLLPPGLFQLCDVLNGGGITTLDTSLDNSMAGLERIIPIVIGADVVGLVVYFHLSDVGVALLVNAFASLHLLCDACCLLFLSPAKPLFGAAKLCPSFSLSTAAGNYTACKQPVSSNKTHTVTTTYAVIQRPSAIVFLFGSSIDGQPAVFFTYYDFCGHA